MKLNFPTYRAHTRFLERFGYFEAHPRIRVVVQVQGFRGGSTVLRLYNVPPEMEAEITRAYEEGLSSAGA